MSTRQKGFTLIELITVIVILGALAVIALPRFIDLQDDAELAATEGVAGALAAAGAINFAAGLAGDAAANAVGNCTDLAAELQGGLASDYSILADTISAGSTTPCVVRNTVASPTVDVTFTGYAQP